MNLTLNAVKDDRAFCHLVTLIHFLDVVYITSVANTPFGTSWEANGGLILGSISACQKYSRHYYIEESTRSSSLLCSRDGIQT